MEGKREWKKEELRKIDKVVKSFDPRYSEELKILLDEFYPEIGAKFWGKLRIEIEEKYKL